MRRVRRYFQWSWNEWLPGPRWVLAMNLGGAALNLFFIAAHVVVWQWEWLTLGNVAAFFICGYSGIAAWRARRDGPTRLAAFDARYMHEAIQRIEREIQARREMAWWN